MTLERINKLPNLKRQPRGFINSCGFCSGKFNLSQEELAAYRVFDKPMPAEQKQQLTIATGKK